MASRSFQRVPVRRSISSDRERLGAFEHVGYGCVALSAGRHSITVGDQSIEMIVVRGGNHYLYVSLDGTRVRLMPLRGRPLDERAPEREQPWDSPRPCW